MEFSDALTITGLGMAVVFSGLLLTAALILVLGRLQGLIDDSHAKADNESTTKPTLSHSAELEAGPPIDPEVLTVIATVLEIEHRLHRVAGGPSKRAASP
jgi:Na+-transporting methylmalonyl-CoA/oxaloacetate decarboxylase gamma subunit